jgi:glutamate-ammonia-ligase adenylyltransferase
VANATTIQDSEQELQWLRRTLRVVKAQASLAIAVADITGTWPVETVTGALSTLADRAISLSVSYLLKAAAARGEIELADPTDPALDSGFIVLALGKLGGQDLNYSSDVDLFLLFDDEKVRYRGRQSAQQFFVRLSHAMVAMLQERTENGYVFRTDLRLRPDPGATPPVVSVSAAESYYESMGQNWERAALIKARPVAGDLKAGDAFIKNLRPFLWRRNLDFAAIRDIHSIKRQINAHHGGAEIKVAGHNVKLGRGGIREIEFFVQTQQLIWGGHDPKLRSSRTIEALNSLMMAGLVKDDIAKDLTEAYRYLRRVEHRLQMIDDRQTHTLPEDAAELRHVAIFLGYDDTPPFAEELTDHLSRVEKHYAALFEDSTPLGTAEGDLVFTGTEDDPGTLETLAKLGFKDGHSISAVVRGWHHGRYRATRSARAREILTELMPALLAALGRTANPDIAFHNFDEFLKRLPAGVQLFSLLHANPAFPAKSGLLDLMAEIMGNAPRLAAYLSENPALLDGVLIGGFLEPPPDAQEMAADFDQRLKEANDFEDVLEIARRFANDLRFRIGVQALKGLIDVNIAGQALTDCAEVMVRRLLKEVTILFEQAHGHVPGGAFAVMALGKLGGRELTERSDLDFVFVYDADPAAERSDGAKPLAIPDYYARLSQRLISALSVQTSEGTLFAVDMRLRPSGGSGPVASSLEAFIRYYQEQAWTWEFMALTRARVIAGDANLSRRVTEAVAHAVCQRRNPKVLATEVNDMRRRVHEAHPVKSLWAIKYGEGGLVDVEFIAQYLILANAARHPGIVSGNTATAYERLTSAKAIEPEAALTLYNAGRLWRTLQGLLRLTVEGSFEESDASDGLKAILAKAVGAGDFVALKATMERTAKDVERLYHALIEQTAKGLPQADSAENIERKTEGSAKAAPKPNQGERQMSLQAGDLAPDFVMPTADGGTISLRDLRGRKTLLYFYPKDDTPGCTREACSFRDNLPDFSKLNVEVIGVSKDDGDSHRKFRDKYSLNFILATDTDGSVVNNYGVWKEKNNYGKVYWGIERTTYLIDENGKIEHIWPKVSVDGHTEEIMAALKGEAPPARAAAPKPATPKAPAAKPAAPKAAAPKPTAKAKPVAKKAAPKKAAKKKVPAPKAKKAKSAPKKTKAVAKKKVVAKKTKTVKAKKTAKKKKKS